MKKIKVTDKLTKKVGEGNVHTRARFYDNI